VRTDALKGKGREIKKEHPEVGNGEDREVEVSISSFDRVGVQRDGRDGLRCRIGPVVGFPGRVLAWDGVDFGGRIEHCPHYKRR
jgi:hypothetical protein